MNHCQRIYCCCASNLNAQEFCDLGTLSNIASDWSLEHENDDQMMRRLILLHDAAKGLQALHAKNVVHGDLVSVKACSRMGRFCWVLDAWACCSPAIVSVLIGLLHHNIDRYGFSLVMIMLGMGHLLLVAALQ